MSRMMILAFIAGCVLLFCILVIYGWVTFSVLRDREQELLRALHTEQRRLWDIPGSNSVALQLEEECDVLLEDQIRLARLLTGTLGGMAVLAAAICLISLK